MRRFATLSALAFVLASCGDISPSDIDTATVLAAEFEVGVGQAVPFRVEDCEHLPDCFASNATSPYLLFGLPPAPGAEPIPVGPSLGSVPSLRSELVPAWRLGPREAVVIRGLLPPSSAYFSLAPYVFDRSDADGNRVVLFASLDDAMNNTHFAAGGAEFGDPFAVVASPDASIAAQVVELLDEANPSRTTLVLPIPGDGLRLDQSVEADGVGLLGRVALFDDALAGEEWLEALAADWEVLRLTPVETGLPEPFPPAARTPRADGVDEARLTDALDSLEQAIVGSYPGAEVTPVPLAPADVIATLLDPTSCIANNRDCLGDNGDTVYSAGPVAIGGGISPLSFPDDGFFVVFGVDHEATGNATYSNAVLNLAEKRAGVAAIDSRSWTGSAATYLPEHPDRDELFAWHFARSCEALPNCTAVAHAFPGVPADGNVLFVFRAYLNPTSTVSTDPSFLLTERVRWIRPSP